MTLRLDGSSLVRRLKWAMVGTCHRIRTMTARQSAACAAGFRECGLRVDPVGVVAGGDLLELGGVGLDLVVQLEPASR